jgi:hypothetical protein
MHGWRKQYCEAARKKGETEWQSFAGAELSECELPVGCDSHGVQMFVGVDTKELELKVREYPPPPTTSRLQAMLAKGEGTIANLALPPVVRQPRGRPQSTKRKLGVLERTTPRKRAVGRCSNCHSLGCRRDRCTNMARATPPALPPPPVAGSAGSSTGFAGALTN